MQLLATARRATGQRYGDGRSDATGPPHPQPGRPPMRRSSRLGRPRQPSPEDLADAADHRHIRQCPSGRLGSGPGRPFTRTFYPPAAPHPGPFTTLPTLSPVPGPCWLIRPRRRGDAVTHSPRWSHLPRPSQHLAKQCGRLVLCGNLRCVYVYQTSAKHQSSTLFRPGATLYPPRGPAPGHAPRQLRPERRNPGRVERRT